MKILHLSTNGRTGGAGLAAWRLHRALGQAGVSSQMLSLNTTDSTPGLVHLQLPWEGGDPRALSFRKIFVASNRTPLSNTWFSAELEGFDLTRQPAVRDADILHLHWISGLLSTSHVAQLLAMGKPIAWTLHDMAAFTGGCHYSAGCAGFRQRCRSCPQLVTLADALAAAQLADKCEQWQRGSLGVIALNSWMAGLAAKAPALAQRKIAVIPNGIDLNLFHPRIRTAERQRLGLRDDAVVFSFAAEAFAELRKGSAVLGAALDVMHRSVRLRKAVAEHRLVFLVVGGGEFPSGKMPVRSLGWCGEQEMAGVMAASDAFVLPSLEDNMPNTVVESLATGTPVIGTNVGGVPELIVEGQTGHLVPPADARALAQALTQAFDDPAALAAMRPACRAFAEKHFDDRKNTAQVVRFYEELLAAPAAPSPLPPIIFPGPALAALLEKPRPDTLGRAPAELLTTADEETESLRNERNLLRAQLADLQKNFTVVEADRNTRGEIIERQGREHTMLQAEFDLRLKELNALYPQFEVLKNERNLLQAQFTDLRKNFAAAEADRNTRGAVIEKQSREHTALQAEFDLRLKELNALYPQFEALKNGRSLLQAQLADLQKNFAVVEADRNTRGGIIERQGREHTALQAEFDLRLKELNALYPQFEALKNARSLLQAQFADLQKNFAALESEFHVRLKELNNLYAEHESLKNARNLLQAQLADLQRNFDFAEQDRVVRGNVIEQQGREGDELRRIAHVIEVDRDAWRGHYDKVHAMLETTTAKLAETELAYAALEAKLKDASAS